MKKVFALLLAVMMLASIGCAWAEGTTEAATEEAVEITFQDIPWGSSKQEVKNWAKERGFQTFPDLGSYTHTYLDATGQYKSGSTMMGALSEDDKILLARDSISFQIAGYTIDQLDFHFDVQDGKTELYTVVVHFQSSSFVSSLDTHEQAKEQSQAILDDLEQKLITVYGENEVPATDNSLAGLSLYQPLSSYMGGGNDRYRKVGAKDTAICLTKAGMSGVLLVYGKTNVFVPEETTVAPLTIDAFNFDGL